MGESSFDPIFDKWNIFLQFIFKIFKTMIMFCKQRNSEVKVQSILFLTNDKRQMEWNGTQTKKIENNWDQPIFDNYLVIYFEKKKGSFYKQQSPLVK